ncbi:MAG: DUF4386 domain-containing protein [Candidatus Eremiobacteraeota bacterium]|nr:DUF4386 domain-containing protein [Candidatus Eremiobacteraeota bacterium]
MSSLGRNARIAGFLYLLLVLAGPVRLIYIPSVLFVTGNAAATSHNIASHEALFRIGIFSDLLTATLDIAVVLALYRLLNGVNRNLAIVMVILGLADVPIYFCNTLNDVAALLFARGTDFLSAFGQTQQNAMTMLFLNLHHYGVVVNEVFWGLWLLPFGLLVYQSRFLPRILGAFLVANCMAYLAQVFAGVLLPQYAEMVSNVVFPLQFGEIAIMLWLIVMGAKRNRELGPGERQSGPPDAGETLRSS